MQLGKVFCVHSPWKYQLVAQLLASTFDVTKTSFVFVSSWRAGQSWEDSPAPPPTARSSRPLPLTHTKKYCTVEDSHGSGLIVWFPLLRQKIPVDAVVTRQLVRCQCVTTCPARSLATREQALCVFCKTGLHPPTRAYNRTDTCTCTCTCTHTCTCTWQPARAELLLQAGLGGWWLEMASAVDGQCVHGRRWQPLCWRNRWN